MERARGTIEAGGGVVLAVGPGSQPFADRIRAGIKLGFPVFGDRGATFEALGFRRVLGVIQQSGTVVAGPPGVVRAIHRATNPGDALRLEEVLAALGAGQR